MPALKTIYIILSAVILSAIAGLVVMTASYNKAFMDTSDAVHHTLTVLDHTQHALSAVLDLDLGKDSAAVIHHIQELKKITADNPLQQARADSLLSAVLAFEHRGTDGVYLSMGYSNRLRSIILGMQEEANRLLALREKANNRSREMLQSAIFVLLVFIFVLLCVSLFLILYNLRRRKMAESSLRESERRFSLLVQHVKDYAIYMIDRQGNVMTWNQGAENMKGYTASEIIGKPISLFYTDEDNQKGEPLDNLQKVALLGRHESIGLRRRKDGTFFYADVVMTPLYDEEGKLSGYIKITRDITDQRKTEEEMKMSLQREKDLNEMKSRFVTLASHEFKTPLSVILSSTSLIEKYSAPEMAEKRIRHIQRIKSNVKNLRQILGDFLSLEKLEEGVIRNNPSRLDLTELAEEVVMDMKESCKAGQSIELQITGEPRIVSWTIFCYVISSTICCRMPSNTHLNRLLSGLPSNFSGEWYDLPWRTTASAFPRRNRSIFSNAFSGPAIRQASAAPVLA